MIFSLLKKIFGCKKVLSNDAPPTSEICMNELIDKTPMPMSINWDNLVSHLIEDGYTLDHFDIHDLRIVAGNKILTIIYDRCELGLHSFGIYDYCSTSDEEGHKLMAQIIRENENDAYKSLIIESSDNEFWINVSDCTNRGAGIHHGLHDQMIDVFEPIILKFIKDNAIDNNVGLCMSYGCGGTSDSAQFLCKKLKNLGLNIHIALIESYWSTSMENKCASASAQPIELSCTYREFQFPEVDNIFELISNGEISQKILLEPISYLKSVISE